MRLAAAAAAATPRRLYIHKRRMTKPPAPASASAAPAPASASAAQLCALAEGRVAGAAALLDDAFTHSDYSWGRALGMRPGRFRLWMEHDYLLARAACQHPASSVACCQDGSLAGVVANEEFNHEPEPPSAEPEVGMAEVEGILDACRALYWAETHRRGVGGSPADRGVQAYIAFLATLPEHRRAGVGRSLVARTLDELRAGGWRTAIAFCSACVCSCADTAAHAPRSELQVPSSLRGGGL